MWQQYPGFAVDAPDFTDVVTAGGATFNYETDTAGHKTSNEFRPPGGRISSRIYDRQYEDGAFTAVSAGHWETRGSVSEIAESLADAYEETTSEYELQPDGARSFTYDSVNTTIVVYPTRNGASSVNFGFRGSVGDCPEAESAIRTHMIESLRLV